MIFPKLDGDPLIDDIIDKCWHNQYGTVAELAAYKKTLLEEPIGEANSTDRILRRSSCNVDQDHSAEDFSWKQEFCQGLEKRGPLRLLASGEPMELGFTMEHRYMSNYGVKA